MAEPAFFLLSLLFIFERTDLLDHYARIKCTLCSNPRSKDLGVSRVGSCFGSGHHQTGAHPRAHLSQKDIQMEILCIGAGHSEQKEIHSFRVVTDENTG